MQQRLIENCFIRKINLIEKLVQDTSNKLTYLADFIFVSKILDKKFYPVKTTNLFKCVLLKYKTLHRLKSNLSKTDAIMGKGELTYRKCY